MIGWKPPAEGRVKLNTDGACKNDTGSNAGCSGVIRDSRGKWCGGFAKFVGNCSAFMAEFFSCNQNRYDKEWEANQCADAMANIGCELDCNVGYFDVCPIQVRHIIASDGIGHSSPRLIPL
ncbi:nucleic acid binding protein [Trifolium pratense]|uniref:Nucleic acid binding protein n=1 Tax=Trifolium pratense TaxID=57577 RepID=A0A2K3L4W9_TRIPR|nr:nucleic acid binding protein [Trifolium pratense]